MIKESLQGLFWRVLSMFFGFITKVILIAYLGTEGFGKISYYKSGIIEIIALFSTFGFTSILIRKMPLLKTDEERQSLVSEVTFISAALYLAVIPGLMFYIVKQGYIQISMLDTVMLVLIVLLNTISDIMTSMYVALLKIHKAYFISFLTNVLNLAFFVIICYFTGSFTYVNYFLSMILAYSIIPLFFFRINFKRYRFKLSLLKDSFSFYMAELVYSIFDPLAQLFSGFFINYAAAGMLSIADSVRTLVVLFMTMLCSSYSPLFSKALVEENMERVEEYYHKIFRNSAYVLITLIIFVFIYSEPLLKIISNDFVANDVLVLQIFMLVCFVTLMSGPCTTLISMSEIQTYEIFNGLGGLTVSLVFSFILGPKYYWGMAATYLISAVFLGLLKMYQVKREFGIKLFQIKVLVFISILSIVEIAIFYFLRLFITSKIELILIGGLVVAMFCAVGFYFSPEREDREALYYFYEIFVHDPAAIVMKKVRGFKQKN